MTYTHTHQGHPTRIIGKPWRVPGGTAVDVASPHFMGGNNEFFYTANVENLKARISK